MIICTNCAHPNPDTATQCEACYTPLNGSAVPPTVIPAHPSPEPAPSSDQPDFGSMVLPLGGDPMAAAFPVSSTPTVSPTQGNKTQLQEFTARLLHIQSNTTLELPAHLSVIHLGKPNDRIPPDVDVSGFADSDVVSRIHAMIRVEGDAYYLEDVGSSNGTYINNLPLAPGNRHRLRAGDRIALGKGDRVSFLFQLS